VTRLAIFVLVLGGAACARGIDQTKVEGVYRAGQGMKSATDVGVTRLAAGAVLVLATTSVAGAQEPLAITSPASGSIVAPGKTLTVNVTSPAGQSFTVVFIAGEGFIGLTRHTTSPLPAQFTIDVPADARLGTYALAALGTTPADTQVAVRIEIDVERPDLPARLTARVPQVVFDRQGQQSAIALLATFADGSVLDATASSRVTYASSNPSVATVDDNGFLRGVGSGVAEITATYTLAAGSRRALVRIIVPAPPYRLSPSSLEFGEQPVGTSSSKDMTLTNTSGDPMNIAGVVAVGDYTASSNCVSPSPLDADAACTVTVTFTPTAAGPRQGALQITELDETFGFRLTGIGTGGLHTVLPRVAR
jgi:centrosomal CEP192-like protein/Big-like domain-containing protein